MIKITVFASVLCILFLSRIDTTGVSLQVAFRFGLLLFLLFALPAVRLSNNYPYVAIVIFFSCLSILNLIYWEYIGFGGLFFLSAIGYAKVLLSILQGAQSSIYFLISVFLSVLASFYAIYLIEIIGIEADFIFRGSRNHVVTLFLSASCFVFISAKYINVKGRHLLVMSGAVLINTYIMFAYTGRAGVISGVMLAILLAIYILNWAYIKKKLILAVTVFSTSLLLVPMFLSGYMISSGSYSFAVQGLHSVRWDINIKGLEYWSSFKYFFGYPPSFWYDTTGYTSHNSYLEIYGYYGWLGVFSFVLIIGIVLSNSLIKKPMLALLLFILLLRSFTDSTLFSIEFATPFFILIAMLVKFKKGQLQVRPAISLTRKFTR